MILPTDLFEAVLHSRAIEVRCSCGHAAIFHPNGLWWRFYTKRWPYEFSRAKGRFYCTNCLRMSRKRVRPIRVEATSARPAIELPMPDERDWKRMIQTMRG